MVTSRGRSSWIKFCTLRRALLIIFLGLATTWTFAAEQTLELVPTGETSYVVLGGEEAPHGRGRLDYFSSPIINNLGQIAFRGLAVSGSEPPILDALIFRANAGGLEQIARSDDLAPDATTFSVGGPAMNDEGRVVFSMSSKQQDDHPRQYVLYSSDSSGTHIVHRSGDQIDGAGGLLGRIHDPVINNQGHIAFSAEFADEFGETTGNGMVLSSTESQQVIALRDSETNDGRGIVGGTIWPKLYEDGSVYFNSVFRDPNVGSVVESILRADASGVSVIARSGDPTPANNGTIGSGTLLNPIANRHGLVAFTFPIKGGPPNEHSGVFLVDGSGLIELARQGRRIPDAEGYYGGFRLHSFNEQGVLAFHSKVTDEPGGPETGSVIMVGDSNGVETFLRSGQTLADESSRVISVGAPLINDSGQMVFPAEFESLMGNGVEGSGLFYYDQAQGLSRIVGLGDAVRGSTVADFSYARGVLQGGHYADGFNESGQFTYGFTLTDGRSGVAIWNPVPEPSMVWTMLVSVLALARLIRASCRHRQ